MFTVLRECTCFFTLDCCMACCSRSSRKRRGPSVVMHRTLWPTDPSSVRGKLELKAAASKAAAEREGQLKRRRDVAIEQASPALLLWSEK